MKLTAARKVAALLNMTDAQLFGQNTPLAIAPAIEPDSVPTTPNASLVQSAFAVPELASTAKVDTPPHAALMRSEALHELAQPPEHIEAAHADASEQPHTEASMPALQDASSASAEFETHQAELTDPPASGGSYLIKFFALFLVALAVAAYLRPKAGEDKPEQETVAPPPMQVPGANENAASPAESQPVASGATANMPAAADKPAETATTSVATDKAAVPTAADKPATGVEKPNAAAANPATSPAK